MHTAITQKITDLNTQFQDLTRENDRHKRQLQQALNDHNQERETFRKKKTGLEIEKKILSATLDKLTAPGLTQKIFEWSWQQHKKYPIESLSLEALLVWLSKQGYDKWRNNAPRVKELEAEKVELEKEKIGLTATVENYWDLVKEHQKEKLAATGQNNYWMDQDDKLRKTIEDLQKHKCSGCHLSTHADYDQIKNELNNRSTCSGTDHQELKLTREKEIIQQIISELELGLDKNSSLNQLITKIKELIARPDNANATELARQLSQAQKIIKQLEQQKTPLGEKLQVIIRIDSDYLSQRWNIVPNDLKSLQRAQSYQELAVIRNKLIEQAVAEQNQNLPTVTTPPKLVTPERVIWLSLFLTSLVTIGGLLRHYKKSKKVDKKSK